MITSSSYIIKGGEQGRARLSVLAQAMGPSTRALLDRAGIAPGAAILDAGCGSGEVTHELGLRVGEKGRVVGIDLDQTKLAAARALCSSLQHVRFESRAIGDGSLKALGPFDVVYARFLLSHLTDVPAALAEFSSALKSGGRIIVEDVDFKGHFSWPQNDGFDAYVEWYQEAAKRRGADAGIGRRLPALLDAAGFDDVDVAVAQPCGFVGPAKQLSALTLAAVADSIVDAGVATRAQVAAALVSINAATDDPTVLFSATRVVQATGRLR